MSPDAREARLVCAILAAQLAALRERIAAPAVFERLTDCTDILAALSARLPPGGEAASDAAQLDRALDELAFYHAQHQDFARQTAELLGRALASLAAERQALTLSGLAALYVSDEQRRIHDDVAAGLGNGAAVSMK